MLSIYVFCCDHKYKFPGLYIDIISRIYLMKYSAVIYHRVLLKQLKKVWICMFFLVALNIHTTDNLHFYTQGYKVIAICTV